MKFIFADITNRITTIKGCVVPIVILVVLKTWSIIIMTGFHHVNYRGLHNPYITVHWYIHVHKNAVSVYLDPFLALWFSFDSWKLILSQKDCLFRQVLMFILEKGFIWVFWAKDPEINIKIWIFIDVIPQLGKKH